MIRIFIADDHQMVIDGLKALLSGQDNLEIVGHACNGDDVIDFVKRHPDRVDILILDINMSGLDGIEVARHLKWHFQSIKILVLSMYSKPIFIKNLLEEGVAGYILKNTGKDELLRAIDKVYRGEEYFSQEVTKAIMDSFKNQSDNPEIQLSKRELEILRLLAKALTTSEIAHQLFLSPYTVDTHRKNLLSKLNLKNTPALVKYAIENGLTDNKF